MHTAVWSVTPSKQGKEKHISHIALVTFFIMPPPPSSLMGEEYCFPRHKLIFLFGGRVIYHFKGL